MYRKLAEFLERGETVALATVIGVRGSVPREVGAKMIIHPAGQHAGTVGGGCGEAEVMRVALDVLAMGQPAIVSVDLTGEVSMESPAICGGVMDVFVERLPNRQFDYTKLQALLESVTRREPVALATVVAAPPGEADRIGNKAVVWPDREVLGSLGLGALEAQALADARQALKERRHRLFDYTKEAPSLPAARRLPAPDMERETKGNFGASLDYANERWTTGLRQGQEALAPIRGKEPSERLRVFVEVQHRPPHLVIVGAGHIAQPLAEMGRLCDFTVTVLDDRPQFANRQRFPQAEQVIAGPLAETLRGLPLDGDTYVVLITRGHQHDVECLLEILDAPLAYLGMIGSRRRVRGVFELLEKERGIPPEKLRRVYAPIGLDIGARTPAEIALAIMAEVIKVTRGGRAPSLSDR
ncbi:MAG: XdhC family protein [Anaerolineae bacterium]|nr:XdhC family protein [Anaerolineae bacterium]